MIVTRRRSYFNVAGAIEIIKLLLLLLLLSQRILWKNENAVYHLQIPALFLVIVKFKNCVKYASEMTDDVIHHVYK